MIKNILITGSDGFIGKNLSLALEHKFPNIDIYKLNRHNSIDDLKLNLEKIDFIYHLAGSNRPHNKNEFENINNKFTNRRIIVNIKFTLEDFECNKGLNQMPFVFLNKKSLIQRNILQLLDAT